jgi:hypothetical protein
MNREIHVRAWESLGGSSLGLLDRRRTAALKSECRTTGVIERILAHLKSTAPSTEPAMRV